jgi:hypothetical protein
VAEAVALLAELGEEAKILAGGDRLPLDPARVCALAQATSGQAIGGRA